MYKILCVSKGSVSFETLTKSPECNHAFEIVSEAPGTEIKTKSQYDAIISGYELPDMNGIELLRKVRASGSHIPFILAINNGQDCHKSTEYLG